MSALLQDIQWSCSTTRAEVRRRARDLGVSIAPDNALPCLQDIDTLQARPTSDKTLHAMPLGAKTLLAGAFVLAGI